MVVNREWDTLSYLDVLCMNGYGFLERTCSHLINKLMFKYPYNVDILKDYDLILERYALSC